MNELEKKILEKLDSAAEAMEFPAFANMYSNHCGARMNIFSDKKNKWLIVIQWIEYVKQDNKINLIIIANGNILKESYFFKNLNISDLSVDRKLMNEKNEFIGNIFDFEIKINGNVKKNVLSKQDYYDMDILNLDAHPDLLICRYCASKYANDIYKSPEELIKIIDAEDVKPFMTLDDWEHPDITQEELPSNKKSFLMIAEAIAQNDPSIFKSSKFYFNVRRWIRWDIFLDR